MRPESTRSAVVLILGTCMHAGARSFTVPPPRTGAPLAGSGSVAGDDAARFDASWVTRGPFQVPNIAKAVATPQDGSLAIARQDALTLGFRVSPSRSLDSVVDLSVLREPTPYRRFFVASDAASAEFAGQLQGALAEVSAIYRPGGITAGDPAGCPSIALAVGKRIRMEPSLLLETVRKPVPRVRKAPRTPIRLPEAASGSTLPPTPSCFPI